MDRSKIKNIIILLGCFLIIDIIIILIFKWQVFSSSTTLKQYYPNFYFLVYLVGKLLIALSFSLPFIIGILIFINAGVKKTKQFWLITIITIIVLEILLRIFGFEPGLIGDNKWLKKVDKLEVYNTYKTDTNSILKVNIEALDKSTYGLQGVNVENNSLFYDHKTNLYNAFHYYISSVANKDSLSEFDKDVLTYVNFPINNDGFYSLPFKKYENTNKIKILLLGDSFTWGHSTTNKTNSFANELLAKGYIVYNTGISGADVAQYEAIAKKYIPLLQPDLVILNFFMGNDISYYKRHLFPYHPILFHTNAGKIMAFQNGVEYCSAQEAYENAINQVYLKPTNWIKKIIIKSSFLTMVWRVFAKLGLVANNPITQGAQLKKPPCNEEIINIAEICKKNNADFLLIAIPDFMYGNTKVEEFPFLFENVKYIYSPIKKEDYNLNDGHFNDDGHIKYANFIDSLIKGY